MPQIPSAWTGLADTYQELGMEEEAARAFKQAQEAERESVPSWEERALRLLQEMAKLNVQALDGGRGLWALERRHPGVQGRVGHEGLGFLLLAGLLDLYGPVGPGSTIRSCLGSQTRLGWALNQASQASGSQGRSWPVMSAKNSP